jgi:hypothetical protein
MPPKKEHKKKKKTKRVVKTKRVGLTPQSKPFLQNSAYAFATAPNRPYVPTMSFIASPYNQGVVPSANAMTLQPRDNTIEQMIKAFANELGMSRQNAIKELSSVLGEKPNSPAFNTPERQGIKNVNITTLGKTDDLLKDNSVAPLALPTVVPSPKPKQKEPTIKELENMLERVKSWDTDFKPTKLDFTEMKTSRGTSTADKEDREIMKFLKSKEKERKKYG